MTQMREAKGIATHVMATNGMISVKYHSTEVVSVKRDGSIVLDTGGWKTATTKTRMNQASNQFGLGYHVYQENHAWYVRYQGQTLPFDEDEITLN